MATSTFSAKITDLVGGTIDDNACDDWMTEGAKEIINQLPAALKAKCATRSTLNNSATTLDLDGKGDIIHVVRLSADSGGYQIPCREIPSRYGDLSNDPNDLNYYATASDPVFWVSANSSGNPTLFVKPLPTANQPAYVNHIAYPTIDNGTHNSIDNFPDEAEYLVVLYAAMKQLLQYQSTMSSSWNSDITDALTAITRELNKADDIINTAHGKVGDFYTSIGDIDDTTELWDNTNKRFTEVKKSLDNAMSLIGFTTTGDKYNADYDLEANMADIDEELTNEDIDLASARMSQAQTQMNAVSTHLSTAQTAMNEVNLLMASYSLELQGVPQYISTASGYISQASGYVAEAGARLQQDVTKYQWYGDQYAKLSAEYQRGLAALKGGA